MPQPLLVLKAGCDVTMSRPYEASKTPSSFAGVGEVPKVPVDVGLGVSRRTPDQVEEMSVTSWITPPPRETLLHLRLKVQTAVILDFKGFQFP